MKRTNIYFILTLIFLFLPSQIQAARIKDIATISLPGEGEIVNQVMGYGLVSGLNNSGDNMQTSFTTQSVINMLKRYGITMPNTNLRIRNVAAVMITATVPNYLKRGAKVDVIVSAIGDAKSLQGGVLIMSPVTDQNGNIIGMAQGPLTVGGYSYENYGARIRKNETTTGRVQNGLILERDINPEASEFGNQIKINLNEPDFTTANNIATVIGNNARIADAGTVIVEVPQGTPAPQYIAQIEVQQVAAALPAAKVVINERTGAIVVNGNVEILPSVIVHGNLEIIIDKYYFNNRPYYHHYGYYAGTYGYARNSPYPFAGGMRMPKPVWNYMDTTVKYDIKVLENYEQPHALEFGEGANIQDLVEGLRGLFVQPRDLIAIFQALKESGSLKAELVIQ
ncbi:MAG: flagellar basal body P-ring protein FlgI [Ignavibacteria bacterium]|jgi:flagellar P-ring protein precursor FlgI|nr:flagellar basal body P-ring protein FlgI [Ignavibacteria bacterium]